MGDIKRIDWHNHDGVNLPMINDFMRNQFYDRVLSSAVNDRDCIDIGFGTGLLSILALKHGANHVMAFERDQNRYELGKIIIERLGLQQKIELINGDYNHAQTPRDRVIFSETVNGNLWQEGLWKSLPRAPGTLFLPSVYWLEIRAVAAPETWASKLGLPAPETRYFDPGIDIDPTFVSTVNDLMADNLGIVVEPITPVQLQPGINEFDHELDTTWGWIPYMRAAVYAGKTLARYELDTMSATIRTLEDTQPIDWDRCSITMRVPVDCPGSWVLVPQVGMMHQDQNLVLETGHWGPCQRPVILHDYTGSLIIDHDVRTGDISYRVE